MVATFFNHYYCSASIPFVGEKQLSFICEIRILGAPKLGCSLATGENWLHWLRPANGAIEIDFERWLDNIYF